MLIANRLVLTLALFSLAVSLVLPSGGETLGPRALRGYGLSSAERSGDAVVVTAATEEKSLLWAARYDHVYAAHRVRPGVYRLPGGGWTSIAIKGCRFGIRYSSTEPKKGYDGPLPHVPMYLNAWDDYAFRFYYRQGCTPSDARTKVNMPWEEYDPAGEFAFAEKNGHAGLVIWANNHVSDTAVGMSDVFGWQWTRRLAEKHGLPVVLNTNGSVPMWIADTWRDENVMKAPGYVGSYHGVGHPHHAGEGFVSWASEDARQAVLDGLAKTLRENDTENVIDFLEPHGELAHGKFTVFLEHGPLVDASFRTFLKEKYGDDVSAVARRWCDGKLRRWDDVKFPAIADFAGYGPRALDLEGSWQYHLLSESNGWTGVVRQMPGHDLGLFLPDVPAAFRRTFKMPVRKNPGERTWLYVWDLSKKMGDRVVAKLNGRTVADEACQHGTNHWMVREVTDALAYGQENEIELELPNGRCMYKVYLTHAEPKAYPFFGVGMNAKWIDFCLWQQWSRERAVRRGLDTLRAVEPDKGVVAMCPDAYFTSMREIAAEYGTRFHNTGYMAAFWCEQLPMLMRSKNLPFSLEPGGPASNCQGFKRMTNYYMAEGVNAIHYFIHIGNVFWDPEIRAEFERRLPALKMMGRYAQPQNEIAEVMDSTLNMVLGYPWRNDISTAYPSGYMTWRFPAVFGNRFQMDGITPVDLKNGTAGRYKYLLDANNTLMSKEDVAAIERYVRAGGTYVAMFQSGRHSPLQPNKWMLHDLAGVELAGQSDYAYVPDERGIPRMACTTGASRVTPVLGPDALPPSVTNYLVNAVCDGVELNPVADDVTVLARWADGNAAVTVRPVGKGRIILYGIRPPNLYEGCVYRLLSDILVRYGAKEKLLAATCGRGMGRHYVTNDGLYDVFYADTGDRAGPYELAFRDGKARTVANVLDGKELPLKGTLGADDFVMGTSPRGEDADAAWHWVKNQFGWWQGGGHEGKAPSRPRVAAEDNTIDLTKGWTVDGAKRDIGPLVVGLDIPSNKTAYVCTRTFTVPSGWKTGDIELWAVGIYENGFCLGKFSVALDGKEIRPMEGCGVAGLVLPVKAGETHTLEIKVSDDRHFRVRGFKGPIYLSRRPVPAKVLDLKGEWEGHASFADPAPQTVTLPGAYKGVRAFRREVMLPRDWKDGRVRIDFTSENDSLTGVIVNGHYLRRHHHHIGNRTDVDITPWVKIGAKNELWIVGNDSPRQGLVSELCLKLTKYGIIVP